MRRTLSILMLLLMLAPLSGRAAGETLLSVDDGDFFYRSDTLRDDASTPCVGDSNQPNGRRALRHWHVGIPFAPAAAEPLAGFGCKGGPKSWTVTVPEGATAVAAGSVRYTWDRNVPGGCCNDVHIHVTDASGGLVASTLETDGYKPINPAAPVIEQHTFSFTLSAGTYTISEDIFAGEHSAWLTKLTVTTA